MRAAPIPASTAVAKNEDKPVPEGSGLSLCPYRALFFLVYGIIKDSFCDTGASVV